MNAKKFIAMTSGILIPSGLVIAQVVTGEGFINEGTDAMESIGSAAMRLLSILMGAAAGVTLFLVVLESNKKNSQNKDAFVTWFCIFALGFLALELINSLFFN